MLPVSVTVSHSACAEDRAEQEWHKEGQMEGQTDFEEDHERSFLRHIKDGFGERHRRGWKDSKVLKSAEKRDSSTGLTDIPTNDRWTEGQTISKRRKEASLEQELFELFIIFWQEQWCKKP